MKKDALKKFAKLTEKHLSPTTLLKRRLWHGCFPVNFVKFLKTLFLQSTSTGCFYSSTNVVMVNALNIIYEGIENRIVMC